MKIGILTFHAAHNYGAVLQCYALQDYLKLQGHEVYVIDYRPSDMLDIYKWINPKRFITRHIIQAIKELKILKYRKQRYDNFNKFIDTRLNLVSPDNILLNDLDYIVIGSDQVWNTHLTNGFDSYYWGSKFSNNKAKLVSYAASMEEYWGKANDTKARKLLSHFSAISVRETSLQKIVEHLLPNHEVTVTVDPTILIPSLEWDKIAVKPKIKEPYLLLYQVRNTEKAYKIAHELASKMKLRLVCLSARVDKLNSKSIVSASPEEFVGLFKYASFVVASSFHGTIFSVIYKRDFIALQLGDGKDSRYSDFLKELNLQSRLIDINDMPEHLSNTNYLNVDTSLANLVANSKKFINDSFV